jgi:hypothetical protein
MDILNVIQLGRLYTCVFNHDNETNSYASLYMYEDNQNNDIFNNDNIDDIDYILETPEYNIYKITKNIKIKNLKEIDDYYNYLYIDIVLFDHIKKCTSNEYILKYTNKYGTNILNQYDKDLLIRFNDGG